MKVTALGNKTSAPYPKLMIDKTDGQIVLVMTDTKEAVTLIPGTNKNTSVGELYLPIDLTSFSDFDGEVTLSN